MVTKKLSALAGFLLLIGCVVGIVIVIYGGGSTRSSSKSRSKESFTGWESKDNLGGSILHGSQPSLQEVNQLADELQKLFSKNSNGGFIGSKVPQRIPSTKPLSPPSLPPTTETTDPAISSKSVASTHQLNPVSNSSGIQSKGIVHSSDMSRNEFSSSPWIPSINPRLQPGSYLTLNGRTSPTPGPQTISSTSIMDASDVIMHNEEDPGDESNHHESDEDEESETSEEDEEDQYVTEREDGPPSEKPIMELGELFDLATNLYASGANASDLQGFLRVINETVNRGNNSGLLAQLNELYSRPGIASSLSPDLLVGRNAYETSLTAFVFMSFGVFLLNQIHGFIGKESSGQEKQSRNFQSNTLEESNLDVLFRPPNGNWTLDEKISWRNISSAAEAAAALHSNFSWMSNGNRNSNNTTNSRTSTSTNNGMDDGSSSSSSNSMSLSPTYVNNMFRALLNLVNAYTKNSQVLECIWSLYCQDLDKTAAKQGLYGIAARINSIGLRLIMDQIPAELTLEVMLRSLLAWDGLPCMKMFPKCEVDNVSVTLQAATSGNSSSPAMTSSI